MLQNSPPDSRVHACGVATRPFTYTSCVSLHVASDKRSHLCRLHHDHHVPCADQAPCFGTSDQTKVLFLRPEQDLAAVHMFGPKNVSPGAGLMILTWPSRNSPPAGCAIGCAVGCAIGCTTGCATGPTGKATAMLFPQYLHSKCPAKTGKKLSS